MFSIFFCNVWTETGLDSFSKRTIELIASLLEVGKLAHSHGINEPVGIIELISYVFISQSDYDIWLNVC